ncbi:MAG: hypothetical protein QXL69_06160 [Candidatus Bathyarchaeia archaeon]|nr:DUF3227 domain-containing protein [Candidatus Bathyarchaeota archaeon]
MYFQNKINSSKQEKIFQEALLKAINESLLVLGPSVKQAVYYHIERQYNIKHEEIPFKLKEFYEALKDIFGFGSKVIEKLFVKKLYEHLGLRFEEHEDWSFIEYVEFAKNFG